MTFAELEKEIDAFVVASRTDSKILGELMMSLLGTSIALAEGLGLDPDRQWKRLRDQIDQLRGMQKGGTA